MITILGGVNDQIVNGKDVTEKTFGKYPFLGAFKRIGGSRAFCTSTLTGSNELISAAHCFMKRRAPDFMANQVMSKECQENYVGCTKAFLGQSDILEYEGFESDDQYDYEDDYESTRQSLHVVDVYIHESYFDPSLEFFVDDIALVILENDVSLGNFTNLATLPPKNYQPAGQGTILGWGKTQYKANFTSYMLKYANVSVIEVDHCRTILQAVNVTIQPTPGIICSYGEHVNGSSPCQVRHFIVYNNDDYNAFCVHRVTQEVL